MINKLAQTDAVDEDYSWDFDDMDEEENEESDEKGIDWEDD